MSQNSPVFCKCGCGGIVPPPRNKYTPQSEYIRYHHMRGNNNGAANSGKKARQVKAGKKPKKYDLNPLP